MKSFATFAALAVWLAGCIGESERPPAAGYAAPEETAIETETPVTTTATTEQAPQVTPCAPGTTRDCKLTWSYQGIAHCNTSVQTCRDDGVSWTTCGQAAAQ